MTAKENRTFSYKELAEILIKHADIKEGHWAVYAEFGLAAANIPIGDKSGEFSVKPSAIVSINTLGIRRYEDPNSLTVDAATVGSRSSTTRRKTKRSKKGD